MLFARIPNIRKPFAQTTENRLDASQMAECQINDYQMAENRLAECQMIEKPFGYMTNGEQNVTWRRSVRPKTFWLNADYIIISNAKLP